MFFYVSADTSFAAKLARRRGHQATCTLIWIDSWGPRSPQKFRKSHWCVPFTATFSKRRKIGALWSERCDASSAFLSSPPQKQKNVHVSYEFLRMLLPAFVFWNSCQHWFHKCLTWWGFHPLKISCARWILIISFDWRLRAWVTSLTRRFLSKLWSNLPTPQSSIWVGCDIVTFCL